MHLMYSVMKTTYIINSDYGENNWEKTFLRDMIRKINNLSPMSTKKYQELLKLLIEFPNLLPKNNLHM